LERNDEFYFDWAMILAREASEAGYSPVGAVMASKKGEAFPAASRREIGNVQHAEFRALSLMGESTTPLENVTLFSTLEPCIMCSGMAAVMKVERIVWLVDDIWGGASRVYNPDSTYIQKRFPTMDKAHFPDLHKEAHDMWIEYLTRTGHADAVHYMLGL